MTATNSPAGLPFPVSAGHSPRRPPHHGKHSAASDFSLEFLIKRARTTNLAVLLLASVATLSLLINVRLWLGDDLFRRPHDRLATRVPQSIRSTLQSPHATLRHLVMVPGHAIYTGCDASLATSDNEWILEPYQRGGGNVRTFIKHITKAAEIAVQDPEALLVYSGGQTRANADSTEAMSYARLARAGNIYTQLETRDPGAGSKAIPPFERATTENYALDSMENLLFSIARFKEFTGHYPTRITVVGFGMKRQRFEDVHRAALRWPQTAFSYVGIDNEEGAAEAYSGERTSGLEPFVKDSYGCKGGLLAKRRSRNPFRRFHPYHNSAPELAELLEYCPKSNDMFPGRLPWD